MTMFKNLVDLIIPLYCAICREDKCVICEECCNELNKMIAPEVYKHNQLDVPIITSAAYSGAFRQLVLQFKDHGRLDLLSIIQTIVKYTIAKVEFGSSLKPIALIPAPSSPQSFARRGFSQTEKIAHLIKSSLIDMGIEAEVYHLLKQNNTSKQVSNRSQTRRTNKVGKILINNASYRKIQSPMSYNYILVDDIITTGSTASECSKVLAKNHFSLSHIWTLAKS